MRLEELSGLAAGRPWKMDFPPGEGPHATIETNKTCNIRCRSCYSEERRLVKSRDEIGAELDLALRKRRLGTVTLLGGEPTLHPELPAVVADVKRRGLRCQILTNGVRFLDPDGDRVLDRLAEAGVDRIFVHIDEGQAHIHRDIEAARRKAFDKLERRRIRFGLALTIYPKSQGRIPGLLRAFAGYRHFDGVLAILAREPGRRDPNPPSLAAEAESFVREAAAAPSAYLPSNLDDGDVRWLVYYLIQNRRTDRMAAFSSRWTGLAAALYRLARGRRLYVPYLSRTASAPLLVFTALVGAFGPSGARNLRKAAEALEDSRGGSLLTFRFVAIQTPPGFDDATGRFIMCRGCPDATIRNGKLMPVCIADRIAPLGGRPPEDSADSRLIAAAVSGDL